MAPLCNLISLFVYSLLIIIILTQPTFSSQSYDKSECTSQTQFPGSNYVCSNSNKSPCKTFLIYRAQNNYNHQTLSSISTLFNTNISQLLFYNNLSQSNPNNLYPGQEIIVPIQCSCPDRFSQSIFTYNNSNSDSLSTIACEVFEALVKAQSLIEENSVFTGNNSKNSVVRVPIRCACPSEFDLKNGVNYLVTYPIIEQDQMDLISRKFRVPPSMIWDANGLVPLETIFPRTTLLIPTNGVPVLDINSLREHPAPSPRDVIPLSGIVGGPRSNRDNFDVLLGGGIFATLVLMGIASGVYVFIRRKNLHRLFRPLSVKILKLTPFTPDFLDGMSKLKQPILCFSFEELRIATQDFGDASVIGNAVYRGRIGGSYWAIEQMNSTLAAHHVVEILTKINHLNVARLEGCCYADECPYLVFEFAENGSLRDCLSNQKTAKIFSWAKRLQIAFDLAVGLHYIHYCTNPTYVHRNINSRNVLMTKDWRAKISGFRMARPLICSEEKGGSSWNESVIVGKKGYLAPEYLNFGQASIKIDVFAFGVVLLELLSAKEAITEEKFLKDCVKFLAGRGFEDSSSCLEKFKGFMDPNLEGDYPLGDAMCLALLAKGCVEEEPLHRPTMNDVLKALSRIL
ncbi:hypothetical protein LguiA_028051 [Lonicera macranthoides]